MIVLVIIGYILLILLVILIAVLFIPIFFYLRANKNDDLYLSISINWFFNAIIIHLEKKGTEELTIDLKIFGIRIPTQLKKVKKKKRVKVKKEKKYNFKYLINKPFLNKIFRLIQKVIKHIAPREFQARLLYGFDNPADTGILCGLIATFSNYFSQYDIKLYPVFDRQIFEGEIFLQGRIFCFVIAYYVLEVVLSKTFRKTIKKVRKH